MFVKDRPVGTSISIAMGKKVRIMAIILSHKKLLNLASGL